MCSRLEKVFQCREVLPAASSAEKWPRPATETQSYSPAGPLAGREVGADDDDDDVDDDDDDDEEIQ